MSLSVVISYNFSGLYLVLEPWPVYSTLLFCVEVCHCWFLEDAQSHPDCCPNISSIEILNKFPVMSQFWSPCNFSCLVCWREKMRMTHTWSRETTVWLEITFYAFFRHWHNIYVYPNMFCHKQELQCNCKKSPIVKIYGGLSRCCPSIDRCRRWGWHLWC